jgi:glutathione S-transferase
MLTLHHAPQSRSSRILWLLEELGADYDIVYTNIPRMDGSGGPDPANPHPDKKVPALVHDGRLVTESVAIALYLTDLFPKAGMGPAVGGPDRGAYLTWLAY